MLAPPPLPRTLEASFRDLDSEKGEVRVSAIHDLLRHARADEAVRERAIPRLEERLSDAFAKARAAAAVGLADLVAKSAVPSLLRGVDDDDAYVRQMALNALGELGDARALPRLVRALTDKRPEMRYQAIIAYCRVCHDEREIVDQLVRATRDDDDAVIHIALRVAEERIDEGQAAGERLLERAHALLEARSPHLRLAAAIVLAKSGDRGGDGLLLRVVRGDRLGEDALEKEDERAAVELVGELGLKEARPHLERRAWGVMRLVKDTCPFHAKIALARLGHPRAVKEILADLGSKRPDVVSGAVVAAGRARLREARAAIAGLPEGLVDPALVSEALARLDGGSARDGSSEGEGTA